MSDSDMPQDPFSELQQGAVALHEMHTAWVDAGFTDDQAYGLTQIVFRGMVGGVFG